MMAGTTVAVCRIDSICEGRKLDTPMERALPDFWMDSTAAQVVWIDEGLVKEKGAWIR